MNSFDTETINRPGGGYACLLIAASSAGCRHAEPKTWADIWAFLSREHDGNGGYVCWNMNFDAAAILHEHYLPWTIVERIAVLGRARWKQWSWELLPSKYCRITAGRKTVTLYDLCQFFGCSLDAAAMRWLPSSNQKKHIPKSWYCHMDAILRHPRKRSTLLQYALQDCRATLALYDRLQCSMTKLGITCDKPISPASLGKQYFPACRPAPGVVNRAFRASYFGGRVELLTLGHVIPSKHQLLMMDIHSAYPSAMLTLHATDGLELVACRQPGNAIYGAYRITVDIPDMPIAPYAVRRSDGVVCYPVGRVDTWVGRDGLDLAQTQGWPYRIHKGYELRGIPTTKPFNQIKDLFVLRKNDVCGLAAKLSMNSMYGKLAEETSMSIEDAGGRLNGNLRTRSRQRFGPLTNFAMAACITELIRLKMWAAATIILAHGGQVHALATDSLLFEGEAGWLAPGDGLGQWGDAYGGLKSAILWGCGRYMLFHNDGTTIIHLRGFDNTENNVTRLRDCKRSYAMLSCFRSETMLSWARVGGLTDCNVLRNFSRAFRVNDNKRYWLDKPKTIGEYSHCCVRSKPWILIP